MFHHRIIRTGLAGLAIAALALPALAQPVQGFFGERAGTLTFDIGDKPAKSQAIWTSTAPMEKIRGTADGIRGSIIVQDAARLETTKGSVMIPVDSMKTGNPTRDRHLKGEEWLDAKNHPFIKFQITRLENVKVERGVATATAYGPIEIHGVAKDISAPVQAFYKADGNALKIVTQFKIALKDFNIKGKSGMVGSKVGEVIDVEATLYATGR